MKPEFIIHLDGSKFWYVNGEYHREDGPAIEWSDGTKYWYVNGQLHREDGPAIEYSDGSKYWYVNGIRLSNRQLISKKLEMNYPSLYNSYLIHIVMGS